MSEEDEVIEEDEVTEAEQIEKAEIRKADFLAVGRARKAFSLTYSRREKREQLIALGC